jgi:hypothetical protein
MGDQTGYREGLYRMGHADFGLSHAQGEFSQTRAGIQDRVETGLQTGLMAIVWL